MLSCMKLHKQPQPFPKAGVKRSPSITQAGTERGPSPKQAVKDFTQVDAYPSNQAYIQVLFQQTLFCSASSPTCFLFSLSTLTLVCSKDSLALGIHSGSSPPPLEGAITGSSHLRPLRARGRWPSKGFSSSLRPLLPHQSLSLSLSLLRSVEQKL